MRKICSSRNTDRSSRFSPSADSRSVPNGFSTIIRTSASSRRCRPRAPSALVRTLVAGCVGNDRKERRGGGQEEQPVEGDPRLLVVLVEPRTEPLVHAVLV